MLKVVKRDGTVVDFDRSKIVNAVLKAMKFGSGIVDIYIANEVADEIYLENRKEESISIYFIEGQVFEKLTNKGHSLTARAYEGYRSIREFQRKHNTIDEQMSEMLGGISEYWNDENSNKNPKLATTQRDYMAGIVSTDLTRRYLLSPDIVQAHDEGILQFHDADYFGQTIHNCSLINLEDMLQNGTCINKVKIDKPKRFITAATISTQIITAVTSSQYGGTTITLTHLAPFVRYSYNEYYDKYKSWGFDDEKSKEFAMIDTKKEVRDGVQTFNYQVNSMSTTNGQSPFLSVFMYLNETDEYKEELAMIIEEFLHQRIKGMKNEVGVYITPAFPKLLYVLEEDNIKEDSKYFYLTKLAAECSAKRLVPDYISEKKMLELKGDCFPNMGCRSFLAPYTDKDGNRKYYGRFNIGVVTINLVDVALSSKGDEKKFWELIENRTELCHKALKLRYQRLKGVKTSVAPILWEDGAFARLKRGSTIDELLTGGYASISLGYAGLYECVKYMIGNSHTDRGVGTKFGKEVMKFLNDKCEEWKKEDNLGYSVYGTPIENTTYKFAKCLRKRFGVIEGITDRDYITNSYHTFVKEQINPFEKISIESEFQELSLGGYVNYIALNSHLEIM